MAEWLPLPDKNKPIFHVTKVEQPPRPTLEDVRAHLEHADTYLREHGWVQGTDKDAQTGRVCAEGAIVHCVEEHETYVHRIYSACKNCMALGGAYSALREALPEPYHSIPDYNDEDGRTVEDIHALYQRAIKRTVAKIEQGE